MARFDKFAPLLKKLEGGFVNDPADKGGATNMGVTLRTYRAIFGKEKTVEDLKHISDGEWTTIMKTLYWDVARCDEIENQSIAELIADWLVNSGTRMIKAIQEEAGVDADGIVGPKTLAAINGANQRCLHCKILVRRRKFYSRIIVVDPSQKKFEKGWNNRLSHFVYEGD